MILAVFMNVDIFQLEFEKLLKMNIFYFLQIFIVSVYKSPKRSRLSIEYLAVYFLLGMYFQNQLYSVITKWVEISGRNIIQ